MRGEISNLLLPASEDALGTPKPEQLLPSLDANFPTAHVLHHDELPGLEVGGREDAPVNGLLKRAREH